MKFLMVLALGVLFIPRVCLADQTVDCSSDCADGEVLVSFADGNNATCLCMPAAQMDAEVPAQAPGSDSDAG
jgi:hypothetical protein